MTAAGMAAQEAGSTASTTGACLHQLFEATAEARPDSLAVVAGEVAVSYRDLEDRAGRLANHLRHRGVGPEVVVGLCVPRSLDFVVATLGILKAGGAVLPLDPAFPPARLAANLADANAALVLTRAGVTGRLPKALPSLCLDREWSPVTAAAPSPGPVGAGPDTLAYVIYTSGSTGVPKGVALAHRGLANEVVAVADLLALNAADRVVQFCSISFDVSVEELFATFAAGATLVLRPENLPVLGQEWLAWLQEAQITVLDLPTAYWHEWVRDLATASVEVPQGIRAVVVGGERALGWAYRTWLEVGGRRVRWLNAYGPAEASVMSTVWEPPLGAELPEGRDPPIGRPLPGTTVSILDDAGAPVPVGVPGELHLGGVGLARGYLGRPDLTAERFVPDPTVPGTGTRLYRTGDVVRRLPGGDLEFVGRLDDQVKVRGFRIECAEVETALLDHPGVEEAVVVAREDDPGDRRLVAYVVVSPGAERPAVDAAALRRFLAQRLPGFMIPTAYVRLDSLPLTATGKIDRGALPAPQLPRGERGRLGARTATEKALAAIWSRVLRVEELGVEEDFFDLGGHSLLATQVIAEVREALGADVPLRAIFEAPTVAGLAAAVDAAQLAAATAERRERQDGPPLVARPRGLVSRLPLSLAQEQMWALEQAAHQPGLYNVTALHRFEGPVDAGLLRRALASLVERHETLRTGFGTENGTPYQWVAPTASVELPVTDLVAVPRDAVDRELRRRVAEEDARAFDLSSPPLVRCHLFLLDAEAVLAATFDHLVCDGPSAYLFLSELTEAYAATRSGRTADLPPLGVQYGDFAVWQRGWATEERLAAQLEYWRRVLQNMPLGPAVPFDHLPSEPARRVVTITVRVDPATCRALDGLARAASATLFVVCVAAVQTMLAGAGGMTDIVMSTTLSGRQRAELDALVGMFAGIARIRTDLSGDPTFATAVERARDTVWGMFENQDIPFMRVRQALFPDFPSGGVEVAAAVPVHLDYFRVAPMPDSGDSASNERPVDELFFRGQLHPLSITFLDDGTQLRVELSFKPDFYDEGTIEGLAAALERLLAVVIQDPSLRLSQLPPRR